MKNLFKLLGVFFLVGSLFVFNACQSDDEIVIIDDTPADGVNVADGLYLAAVGADPAAGAVLTSENVETDGFQSQARDGFVGGYVYLDAGDYNFVQVANKAVTTTWGGGTEEVTDAGSSCDFNTYTVVSLEENGSAFNVADSGLYRVTFDQVTGEMVVYQVVHPGIIGNATPGGWGEETSITDGSVTADGGSWSISDVVLRNGQWKIRFNCRWNLDRRIDPNAGFDPSNGYQLFTNFGGSIDDLQNGNDAPNIEQTEEGTYTITINWNSFDGWTVVLDRTGDAPTLSFDPNDYNLGVIGDATAGSWDSDRDMLYKLDGTTHKWHGVVTLTDAGEFKIRANDAWDFNLGGALAADGVEVTLAEGGDNVASPGAGQYYIVVSTADEGATWQATMTNLGWSIIGSATPGSWDSDTNMVAEGFDAGVTTYTYSGPLTEGEFKFRAGNDWAMNLGGDLGTLILDGNNLAIGSADDYKITMTFDGSTYTATIEAL